ncbi:GNAT family N-acetyltransferase [Actinomycetospora endophytica]|uniref:GNAT family N-acetyltransferase n=1 Tax=Actinomycetospora endophytica TaxID=2291215 RepID=A0ABS8P8M6_9PSEU|nr:GNAT family N-acetyltransferase [Actinomycetospora endophytica]MCD2194368.1 GNAT family N-acetyltransferase [Actinomycetospora endophytica]
MIAGCAAERVNVDAFRRTDMDHGAVLQRHPTPADTDAVVALLGELGYPDEPGVGERLAAWAEDPRSEVTVVDDDGTLVGLVAVTAQPGFHHAEPLAVVVSLVVSSAARGGGVGRRLIDVAERFARDHGCAAIQLSSGLWRPEAHAFYQRLGFTDRGETHVRYARPVPYED